MSNNLVTSDISINILDEEYTIRGCAEESYIKELGLLVKQRMQELKKNTNTQLSDKNIAVLTAINIADELLQEKIAQEVGLDDSHTDISTAHRTSELIRLLDRGMSSCAPVKI